MYCTMTLAITLLATCTLCNIFVLCTNNLCKRLPKASPNSLYLNISTMRLYRPLPRVGSVERQIAFFVSFRLALHRAILVQKWLECGVIRNYIRTKRNMGQMRFNIPSARIFTDSGKNIQRCFSLAQRRTPMSKLQFQTSEVSSWGIFVKNDLCLDAHGGYFKGRVGGWSNEAQICPWRSDHSTSCTTSTYYLVVWPLH